MPELPEVETTLRGIHPHIFQQTIMRVHIRQPRLRWPIPAHLSKTLKNQSILNVERRAKYLLIHTTQGTLIMHLGMSGRVGILTTATPAQKHDHFDIEFSNAKILRFTDPRRFGCILWTAENPLEHFLLQHLGPEPLSRQATGRYLWECAQGKKIAVKNFIMNNAILVGVGNIYAAESLFAAGIDPRTPAENIALNDYRVLMQHIKTILRQAIQCGGTTLKDFVDSDGKPGYFRIQLKVYGREGLPCMRCSTALEALRIGQRNTVFCPACQLSNQTT